MNFKKIKKNKAFTLIELLVVISIISLLSSIVLTSLGGARNKAKDSLLKQEVSEMSKILILNYAEKGNLSDYMSSWPMFYPGDDCSGMWGFETDISRQNQFVKICQKINMNIATDLINGAQTFFIVDGVDYSYCGWDPSCFQKYSISVLLNSGKWYCKGSSGTSEFTSSCYSGYIDSGCADAYRPGCFMNP